jgi:beta-mannosidase
VSAPAPPRLPDGAALAVEVIALADWQAAGVPPGFTDHRLDGLEPELLPCPVPGTAAAALLGAGLWPAGGQRDLDAEDWWFRCRFDADPAPAGEETALRLEGVATLADVWLNGEHVLSSQDMHDAHEIVVDDALAGANELVIGCRALAPALGAKRPRPRWRTRLVPHQGLRWLRTSLTGRIPAFAPGPAPVGPWRPVTLVRRRRAAVERLSVRARVDARDGVVRLRAALRPLGDFAPAAAQLVVDGPTGRSEAPLAVERNEDAIVVAGEARIVDAALWWPHTHGEPALYDVSLVVAGEDDAVAVPCGPVGFRSVTARDEPGLALDVNGVPLFCRGGSLLPDAVTVDPPAAKLRTLLERCRDAGMNMLRLSGVGTYGSEELYRLCDELGLLVWQDFPFANLDYPIDDDSFRAAVEHEAASFLARAGGHASLAVLCGSSEIEQQVAMLGLDPALGRGPLFEELLPGLVREHDVDAHYVTSTPTGGELPFRPDAGVAHYFGVGAYRRPLEDARRAEVRFAAECLAFANVPGEQALDELGVTRVHEPAWKAGVPRDTGAGWDFDDVRDYYLRELFRVDPAELRSADPERYLALSRIVTGEVMAATLGEWRRERSQCRGALLWTLNDVVPGAGWGVLDDRGRPKPAYWYVRRALAPVALWMTDEGTNGLAVHAANDTALPLAACFEIALHGREGQVVDSGRLELELGRRTVVERAVEGILGRFVDAGYAYRFGPPAHEVVVATLTVGESTLGRAFHFPLGRPASATPAPRLSASAARRDDGRVRLRVTTDLLAYGVSVSTPGFDPSDDWFSLAPNGTRDLLLTPRTPETVWSGGEVRTPVTGAYARIELEETL